MPMLGGMLLGCQCWVARLSGLCSELMTAAAARPVLRHVPQKRPAVRMKSTGL